MIIYVLLPLLRVLFQKKNNIKKRRIFVKICMALLAGLLVASQCVVSASDHSVYYEEFKALKKSPSTQLLFDEDIDGGSHTTQCNLEMYRPTFLDSEDLGVFTLFDQCRRQLSLGSIQRNIAIGKELSLLDQFLQAGLCDINADLIIVTSETMPALYNYVESIAKKAKISTPVVFVSLKKGFFKAFSRKILMFTGSVVIGQELLHDVSDEELEALVAQQIGHIKYHHTNKMFLLKAAAACCVYYALNKDMGLYNNRLLKWFIIPALSSLIVSKRFEKHADMFACNGAGKSNGLIKFYERLQEKDKVRAAEFGVLSHVIQENAADLSMLTYINLMAQYYLAKIEHSATETYNKFAYPSHQARIDSAKKYLS